MLRTHTCGELRKKDIGKKAKLSGWVDTIRQHGKMSFVDLRDRYGKTQIVIRDQIDLKQEYCISVLGEVKARKPGTENKELETGDIEIFSDSIKVFNESPALPFEINDDKVGEEARLKFRYLDLRSDRMQKNIILRHKVYRAINDYMAKAGFIFIETPTLAKATPEGARDYIVPSRIHPGKFYALPQSPQLFKQLSMISGFDKYYQIVKCFRDEDSRSDRQPEFTQLDIEMSFIEEEDLIKEMEALFKHIFKEILSLDIKTPFPRMTYQESIKKYKTDAPDTRKKSESYSFVWITNFPMFDYSEEDKKWKAMHHPFTSPEDNSDFSKPDKILSKGYDLVLNGQEIGGGSIRIHNQNIQEKVFDVLGISKKEAKEKFGFLLDALSHGAPPHGGIAFGLDRILQIITKSESIREVIAFPKNKAAQDVMLDAPSSLSKEQLEETHIKLDIKKQKEKKK